VGREQQGGRGGGEEEGAENPRVDFNSASVRNASTALLAALRLVHGSSDIVLQ
jgi:hypothetical protein